MLPTEGKVRGLRGLGSEKQQARSAATTVRWWAWGAEEAWTIPGTPKRSTGGALVCEAVFYTSVYTMQRVDWAIWPSDLKQLSRFFWHRPVPYEIHTSQPLHHLQKCDWTGIHITYTIFLSSVAMHRLPAGRLPSISTPSGSQQGSTQSGNSTDPQVGTAAEQNRDATQELRTRRENGGRCRRTVPCETAIPGDLEIPANGTTDHLCWIPHLIPRRSGLSGGKLRA